MEITTLSQLETFVASGPKVVIFYGSEGCPACRQIKPLFEKIAARYSKYIKFGHVESTVMKLDYRFIPDFISYQDGVKSNVITGADEEQLKNFIRQLILSK